MIGVDAAQTGVAVLLAKANARQRIFRWREVSAYKLLKEQVIISVIRKLDKDALNLYSGPRYQGGEASFGPKN